MRVLAILDAIWGIFVLFFLLILLILLIPNYGLKLSNIIPIYTPDSLGFLPHV